MKPTGQFSKHKVVVLAHVPPPFHGQSLMVAELLKALESEQQSDPEIVFHHVDCRYSADLKSLGAPGWKKLLLAFRYALQTLAVRFRTGADTLYYAPAPGKRPAFWRDCIVLSLTRPFFARVVFHWHAAGLAGWLRKSANSLERLIGRWIFSDHETSIVMVGEKASELADFSPARTLVIPYGIPDPCPDFAISLLPKRQARATELFRASPAIVRLLYLSMASREKGVFDALEVWRYLNQQQDGNPHRRFSLTIAGEFPNYREEKEFHRALTSARSVIHPSPENDVRILGWVQGLSKLKAFEEADIFLFPSTYPTESFGVVLAEAALCGLPCVTYQPLVGSPGMPAELHCRVFPGNIPDLADGVCRALASIKFGETIRQQALHAFAPENFHRDMLRALFRKA